MSGAKIEDDADVNDQIEEAEDQQPNYPQTSPSGEKDSDDDNSEAREERIHKMTLK